MPHIGIDTQENRFTEDFYKYRKAEVSTEVKKIPTFIFKMKNRKTKKKIDRWTDGEIDERRDGYGQT